MAGWTTWLNKLGEAVHLTPLDQYKPDQLNFSMADAWNAATKCDISAHEVPPINEKIVLQNGALHPNIIKIFQALAIVQLMCLNDVYKSNDEPYLNRFKSAAGITFDKSKECNDQTTSKKKYECYKNKARALLDIDTYKNDHKNGLKLSKIKISRQQDDLYNWLLAMKIIYEGLDELIFSITTNGTKLNSKEWVANDKWFRQYLDIKSAADIIFSATRKVNIPGLSHNNSRTSSRRQSFESNSGSSAASSRRQSFESNSGSSSESSRRQSFESNSGSSAESSRSASPVGSYQNRDFMNIGTYQREVTVLKKRFDTTMELDNPFTELNTIKLELDSLLSRITKSFSTMNGFGPVIQLKQDIRQLLNTCEQLSSFHKGLEIHVVNTGTKIKELNASIRIVNLLLRRISNSANPIKGTLRHRLLALNSLKGVLKKIEESDMKAINTTHAAILKDLETIPDHTFITELSDFMRKHYKIKNVELKDSIRNTAPILADISRLKEAVNSKINEIEEQIKQENEENTKRLQPIAYKKKFTEKNITQFNSDRLNAIKKNIIPKMKNLQIRSYSANLTREESIEKQHYINIHNAIMTLFPDTNVNDPTEKIKLLEDEVASLTVHKHEIEMKLRLKSKSLNDEKSSRTIRMPAAQRELEGLIASVNKLESWIVDIDNILLAIKREIKRLRAIPEQIGKMTLNELKAFTQEGGRRKNKSHKHRKHHTQRKHRKQGTSRKIRRRTLRSN